MNTNIKTYSYLHFIWHCVQVLELSVGSVNVQDLGIDKMINKFFMELTKSVSKLPASGNYSLWLIKEDKNVVYPTMFFLLILLLKELTFF